METGIIYSNMDTKFAGLNWHLMVLGGVLLFMQTLLSMLYVLVNYFCLFITKVYEDIAEHFSGTRYKAWPKVVDFLMEQPPLSLMADVGCGNGKCLGVAKQLFEVSIV